MDEKLRKYLSEQFQKLFYGFPEPKVRREILLEIYHAGCKAQSEADLVAVSELKTVRYNFYANEYGDAYLKSGVEVALAAAAIKEAK